MCSVSIYIPETIKCMTSGFLSGKYLNGRYNCEREPPIVVIDEIVEESLTDDVVGEISTKRIITRRLSKDLWITVETTPVFVISSFVLDGKIINLGDVNLIFYDPAEIRHSYLLCKFDNNSNASSKSLNQFIQRVKVKNKDKIRLKNYSRSKFSAFLSHTYILLSLGIYPFLKGFNDFLMKRFDAKSFAVDQIMHRFREIEKFRKSCSQKEDLKSRRLVGILAFDILLGILSYYYICNSTSASELHLWFLSSANTAATNVQHLLQWLRGAPAGLKLNEPLAEFLAAFFSYHVYLWTLYIEVASPVLAVMSHLFVFVGLLGISLQIAFLVDFLNFAVLHIHCFYIYAARLHMVQMSLLGSQWRAFRGRKWNPLKERVDTRSEHRQRPLIKIISAVGFTLVVFLLPTTTIYYAVFVVLRLCLLLVQGFVSVLLWALNSNPVYIVGLHVLGSPLLKGKIHFEIEDHHLTSKGKVDRPIQLKLSIKSSPLKEVILAVDSDVFPLMPTPNVGRIWRSLVYGIELL